MTATANTTTAPIDEVVDLLRQLHLPHMRRQAPELLATAKAQRWDPAEAVLRHDSVRDARIIARSVVCDQRPREVRQGRPGR